MVPCIPALNAKLTDFTLLTSLVTETFPIVPICDDFNPDRIK